MRAYGSSRSAWSKGRRYVFLVFFSVSELKSQRVNDVFSVYLAGQSKLHDATAKSVRRASNLSVNRAGATGGAARKSSATPADPSEESVHPGPIFLSHVVSRKFTYRWLILGISAFSCMAIIVIVSVVYSNR